MINEPRHHNNVFYVVFYEISDDAGKQVIISINKHEISLILAIFEF